MNNYNFTKKDTNIVKGIAILAMVLHHTYPSNPGLPFYMWNDRSLMLILSSCGKVCVTLLTILSGYGLAESYRNKWKMVEYHRNIRFILSHCIQLISLYWVILAWAYLLAFMQGHTIYDIYGKGFKGLQELLLDILGLGGIGNGTIFIGSWYITAIIIYYILFPGLKFLVKKCKYLVLILTYMPWIYYIIQRNPNMHTDWWLFYIFPFVVGIYLSQNRILSKIYEALGNVKGIVISLLGFACMLYLRLQVTLPMDTFLAFSVILLEMFIFTKVKVVADFLNRCGTQSANIWLLHGTIGGLIGNLNFTSNFMKFVLLMFLSMAVSIMIEEIKNYTQYNKNVNEIRKSLVKEK